jgi:hypothetical protein
VQKPDQKAHDVEPNPVAGFVHLTAEEVRTRIDAGWRCTRFECCVSVFVASSRLQSRVYLTENWQERYLRGLGYTALTLLFGPWGAPWGLVWTVRAIWINLIGGCDVTLQIRDLCGNGTTSGEEMPSA